MLDKLLNFISLQKLFQSEQKILLAVSGGIDSMVLAHLFNLTKFNYSLAHCNFKLRGEDSEGDQQFVNDIAADFKVPCFNKSFKTEEYSNKHGISIQMAARDLRRAWFEELLKEERFACIATAHHLNDSLETVLFNLAKGTGIAGLKGVLPKNENYIRPLMFASRDMIHDYAKEHDISWREDRSNISVKYHRNLIRHKVIPELKKINPRLEETFAQTQEKIISAERIFRQEISCYKEEFLEKQDDGYKIDKEKIQSTSNAQIILLEILDEFGFNYQQVKKILLSLDGQSGKIFLSDQYQLIVDRVFLFISMKQSNEFENILIDEETACIKTGYSELSFEVLDQHEINLTNDNNIAFLDFEKLHFPLEIRKWAQGDKFQPLGMQHKKKLSDFMIDKKIPLNLKSQVLVLTSGKNIAWVIGQRIDERYKVSEKTKIVYKICNKVNNDKSI